MSTKWSTIAQPKLDMSKTPSPRRTVDPDNTGQYSPLVSITFFLSLICSFCCFCVFQRSKRTNQNNHIMSITVSRSSPVETLQNPEQIASSCDQPATIKEQEAYRADSPLETAPPDQQTVALLHAARQPFHLTKNYPVPVPKTADELVIEVRAIGLNPVDWKSV